MRLGIFALTLTLAALCGFGSAPAFGRWILGGIDLSSGNSEVMSLPSPPASLWYAILSGVLLATMLWPIWQKAGRRIALAWAPPVAVLFYLAFKHGYVRGDGHIVNFHTAMPVLAISGLLLATGWRMVALTLLISATAAAGLSASGADLSPTQFARRLSPSAITTLVQPPASWSTWQRQQHQAIADRSWEGFSFSADSTFFLEDGMTAQDLHALCRSAWRRYYLTPRVFARHLCQIPHHLTHTARHLRAAAEMLIRA